MDSLASILISIWLGLIFIGYTVQIINKVFVVKSNSKRVRKRVVKKAIEYLLNEVCSSQKDYKVASYSMKWGKESPLLKQIYLDKGYYDARVYLVSIVEKYERFVEEYKYNTFSHLTWEEQDLIDNYKKQRHARNNDN